MNIPISLLSSHLERYCFLVCTGERNWAFEDPVCIDGNAKKNVKNYKKGKGMKTLRDSHGKHF